MQNQQIRNTTQSINQTQSLAAIQTLLRAGLGTITYLRNLLPEDNFTRSHFTAIDDGASSQPEGSQESTSSRTHVSGFRITTITRGYTDEADRLLNYMEYGIFDALEKRYLRSFIFGIYLDVHNPTNIVEAYTFNFKYHMIPESGIFVPLMSLAEGQKDRADDPIAKALKNGKTPTLKDVKMSVKVLLKTLIQAISNMDVLPRRRFATFKVFYTDETPADYEPPHFEPGDVNKDRWFFMTHDLDEVPERSSIGKINTGHHSVNLNVTSIASYLPSSSEHGDDAAFSGLVHNPGRLVLTPQQEATFCKTQAEKQFEDAKNRNLVWAVEDSVELSDADAEGEDDPDYVKLTDGTFEKISTISPIGIRNNNGDIAALPEGLERAEAHYGGISENVPRHLHEMQAVIQAAQIPGESDLEETQPLIIMTPKDDTAKRASIPVSAPVSEYQSTLTPLSSPPTSPGPAFDPEMLKNMRIDVPETCDTEMLDLETQVMPTVIVDMPEATQELGQAADRADECGARIEKNKPVVDCECGIDAEGEACYCKGGCRKWFHIWCMGYHTVDDDRMPSKFICFDCRIRGDMNWELIKLDLYPRMILKFKDLALFRRAIKVSQELRSFTSLDFSKSFGGDFSSAGMILKLLQDQDFVLQESVAIDDMGVKVATRSKKGKNGKDMKPKARKNMQKTLYVFNQQIQTKDQFLDYFKPNDQEVEMRMLGISDMKKTGTAKHAFNALAETQTQEETQDYSACAIGASNNGKRTMSQHQALAFDHSRPQKKLKMSVAAGVDLAE